MRNRIDMAIRSDMMAQIFLKDKFQPTTGGFMLKVSVVAVASLVIGSATSFAQPGAGVIVREAAPIVRQAVKGVPAAAKKPGSVELTTEGRVSSADAAATKKNYKTNESGTLVRGSQYTETQTGSAPAVQGKSSTATVKSVGANTTERSSALVRPTLVKTQEVAPVAKEASATAAPEFTGQTVTVADMQVMVENPTEASLQAVNRIASANKIVYELTGEILVGPETCTVAKYSEPGLINIAEESVAAQTSVKRGDKGDCAKWKIARSYLNTTQGVLKFDVKTAKPIMDTRFTNCKTPQSFNPANFVNTDGTMKPAPKGCSTI
jgi:hypothetical protein